MSPDATCNCHTSLYFHPVHRNRLNVNCPIHGHEGEFGKAKADHRPLAPRHGHSRAATSSCPSRATRAASP